MASPNGAGTFACLLQALNENGYYVDSNDSWQLLSKQQRMERAIALLASTGIILTDANGEQRYVRIGAIVAELRDDMTAEELMQSEIDAYTAKQDAKAEKAKKKAEKIASDKAKREEKVKEGEQV